MTGIHGFIFRIVQVAAVAIPAAAGTPEYAVVNIHDQLGANTLSNARAVSEDGDAVGDAFLGSNTLAFVYTYEHGAQFLPAIPGLATARANDVTERDPNGTVLIVGDAGFSSFDPTNPAGSVAVYWRYATTSGMVLAFGEIGGLPGSTISQMYAVNNNGVAIGWSSQPTGSSPIVYDFASGQLAAFSFPVTPTTLNNLDQVAGGEYIGDLLGSAVPVGHPDTANSARITELTDGGQASASVGMPFSDGAGRRVAGAAWYGGGGWSLVWANSAFDLGSGVNEGGDVVGLLGISAAIRPAIWLEAEQSLHLLNDLITPTQPISFSGVHDINDNRQVVTSPAAVLTPLGEMIIPGDVNGDTEVRLDDLCAWTAAPVDLDGDGDADGDDEQWLLDRLASLGLVPQDCNANGAADTCDVLFAASADCNGNAIPDECEPDCDADGQPDECEADCNGNGTPDDCDLLAGTATDCNLNGILDECDAADTITSTALYDPPQLLIPDNTFTDSVLVTNPGELADVDVTLNLDWRIGDLIVRLSHAGQTVTLVDRPGYPDNSLGNGQLGYRITLDDEGSGPNIEDVGNFGSPFEPIESPPSYRPHAPLSAFDGLPREGTWTIEVETLTAFLADPKVTSWGLVLTDVEVPVGPCGDLDGDGDVDLNDLAALLADFGCAGGACTGDADGDGDTDLSDLAIVLANFGV